MIKKWFKFDCDLWELLYTLGIRTCGNVFISKIL